MFRIGVAPAPGREPLVPSAVLGVLIFVGAEIMMFAGFISAFAIVKAGAMGVSPPPGPPRLPAFEEDPHKATAASAPPDHHLRRPR